MVRHNPPKKTSVKTSPVEEESNDILMHFPIKELECLVLQLLTEEKVSFHLFVQAEFEMEQLSKLKFNKPGSLHEL